MLGCQETIMRLEKIDFTGWLEYFTDGIIDELIRVSKELEKFGTNPTLL